MAKKFMETVGTIHDQLEPLDSADRKRVILGVLALLGESAEIVGGKVGDKPPAGGDAGGGDEDNLSGISPRGSAWMKKEGLTREQIDQHFHVDKDGVAMTGNPIGKSKRAKTINTYLLAGVKSLLQTGDADFLDKEARESCDKGGCYDKANHYKYLKDFENKITGSKKGGWKVTTPGLVAAAGLLKTKAAE